MRIIRPGKTPLYNIHYNVGIKLLTRLRVHFSPLNEHRFRHNFDCLSPICICGSANKDNEHYLLHFPKFTTQRHDLLGQVSDVGYDVANMNSSDLCNLLLYGKPNNSTFVKRIILEAAISFIKTSGRFN